MSVLITFGVGLVAGIALGIGFFGGLWWTSRRLATHGRPAVLVTASLIGRLVLLAVALVVLVRLDPAALVGAVVGLLAARHRFVRAATAPPLSPSTTPGPRTDRRT